MPAHQRSGQSTHKDSTKALPDNRRTAATGQRGESSMEPRGPMNELSNYDLAQAIDNRESECAWIRASLEDMRPEDCPQLYVASYQLRTFRAERQRRIDLNTWEPAFDSEMEPICCSLHFHDGNLCEPCSRD